MTYIILTIIASTLILVLFRLIGDTRVNTRHAIVINYLTASCTGAVFFDLSPEVVMAPWFYPAAVEGMVFYLVFCAIAKTAQTNGVAIASIATKMSVVVPVSVGILLLGEGAGILKIIGILCGLMAVFLSAGKNNQLAQWKWPLVSFIGIGLIDTSLKLFQVWSVPQTQFAAFITTIFAFAFLTALIHHLFSNHRTMSSLSVGSGLLIGLVNFGTVYFLLHALATPGLESSAVFPITNFGVVALSTFFAYLLFNERLTQRTQVGLVFAALSISLLYLSTR